MSCILPVRNGERFLTDALASVLGQDDGDLHVIVVDDGSTDGTSEVLASFGDRIRVLTQDARGVAAARNRALREIADGWVAFQDADDLWVDGKLAAQRRAFDQVAGLELCVGHVQNFWMDEVAEEARGYEGSRFAQPVPGFCLPALLIPRAVFDRVGDFDESLRVGSDNDWFVRARDAGLVEHVVEDVVLHRRLHRGNLTREDLASRETLLRNMKASLDRRRSHGGG